MRRIGTVVILTSLLCSSRAAETGTAEHVIYLLMSGGMSRYETFDPKEKARADLPDAPEPIATEIANCEISETLPNISALLDRCLLLRSVEAARTHVEEHAAYFRRTGYQFRTTIEYPELGAWIAALKPNGTYFRLNNSREQGAALFESSKIAPVVIPNPSVLATTKSNSEAWKRRSDLGSRLRKAEQIGFIGPEIVASILARERVQEALDWNNRPGEEAKFYGENDFGASCFLARRLVEMADATFVEVTLPGWDVAKGDGYFSRLEAQCRILDQALSALIRDLEQRDMLATTLVVLASDYDRSPALRNGERGPFSQHSVALLFGGGIRGGKVLANTDPLGYRAIDKPVSARALNSLIARALRIDPFIQEFTPSGRPVSIGNRREKPMGNLFEDL